MISFVFGKYAGTNAAEYANGSSFQPLPADPTDYVRQQIDTLQNGTGKERAAQIGRELRHMMFEDVGVFRTQEGLTKAVEKVHELRERFTCIKVADTTEVFNQEMILAWELGNLLDRCADHCGCGPGTHRKPRWTCPVEDFPRRDERNG